MGQDSFFLGATFTFSLSLSLSLSLLTSKDVTAAILAVVNGSPAFIIVHLFFTERDPHETQVNF
jgi:hypothetical protein